MESKFLNALLDYYHISKEEYETLISDYDLSNFSDGHHFENIEKAKDIILDAVKNNKRIVIYGDFDADGIMGTSILVRMFQLLNYQASYYIPSRYIDGYGLNVENASKCIGKYDLVICVDNGIVANEPIKLLKDNGIDVVVIDHHTRGEELPIADAIVHPQVSNYGETASSGAFSAFMFSKEVLGYYDKYLATMAAISLISDMMPLKEYNRKLLKAIFKDYMDNEFLPISLLAEHKPLDEKIIGSLIAPKINAVGRIIEDKSINLIVKYFTTDDKEFILTYFDFITNTNNTRKEMSKDITNNILSNLDDNALVNKLNIKEGLIGLVANGVMNKLHKPAIVFTHDKDGNLKGSARSFEGFNIVDAFTKLNKYMIASGGHALAGGCSIKESDYDSFKKDFINLVNNSPIVYVEKPSIDISINDINKDNYEIYNSFSPFGEEWEAPLLSLKGIKVEALQYSKDQNHILTKIGNNAKLVGFNISKDSIKNYNFIDLKGRLSSSSYKNIVTYEFHIEEVKEHI